MLKENNSYRSAPPSPHTRTPDEGVAQVLHGGGPAISRRGSPLNISRRGSPLNTVRGEGAIPPRMRATFRPAPWRWATIVQRPRGRGAECRPRTPPCIQLPGKRAEHRAGRGPAHLAAGQAASAPAHCAPGPRFGGGGSTGGLGWAGLGVWVLGGGCPTWFRVWDSCGAGPARHRLPSRRGPAPSCRANGPTVQKTRPAVAGTDNRLGQKTRGPQDWRLRRHGYPSTVPGLSF